MSHLENSNADRPENQEAGSLGEEIVRLRRERDEAQDEIERLRAAQFLPSGDNHHNAALCPYCGEPLRKALAEVDRLKAEVAELKSREFADCAELTLFQAIRDRK